MAANPGPCAPLRRIGAVLAVIAVGLASGVGAMAVARTGGSATHRAAIPSVTRFRLPRSAAIAAPPVDDAHASFVEPASARAAVEAYLGAERGGDTATAFGLLAAPDQDTVGSPSAWAASSADRPRPTGFAVTAEHADPEGTDVTVDMTRQPSLDPFAGFVSARATQVWRVVREDGRWRVQDGPETDEPVLPPAAAAMSPADRWVRALASCDRAGARLLQAVPELYGPADLVAAPCRERGTWDAGTPVALDRAADLQPLFEAFGPDVGSWARLVPVHGPRSRFFAAVAPVGDDWRVIAVTSDGG